jgi:SAM-dependent methyltransferase
MSQPDTLFPTGTLELYECLQCGLAFLDPRMTFEAMQRLEDVSQTYAYDEDELEREIEARIGLVESLAAWSPRRGTLLDVGCNRGLLLAAAERAGWRAAGVEISNAAAELARRDFGATVYGQLSDVPTGSGFDLVVAWHVLEHTADPVGFLLALRPLLADVGVLALQVPSFDFVDEFARRGEQGSIICAVHNLCFTANSLEAVLVKAGFDVLKITNSADDLMLTALAARPERRGRRASRVTSIARRARRRIVRLRQSARSDERRRA